MPAPTLTVVPSPRRSTSIIAEEIRREVDAAEADFQSAVAHAIRAGELLIEAKAQVGHGNWLPWLKANFDGSERTAQNYMRLALKSAAVADLPTLREAIATTASPKVAVCTTPGCDEPSTHGVFTQNGEPRPTPMSEAHMADPKAGGVCFDCAEKIAADRNAGRRYRVVREPDVREALHEAFPGSEPLDDIPTPPTVASGGAGNPTQAQVDEARHRAGEPYGEPPRRPEHVEQMHAFEKEKPHPKGLGKSESAWVTVCSACSHDLYYHVHFDDDAMSDFEALVNGSVAGAAPSG
jgi:hypothetical protein